MSQTQYLMTLNIKQTKMNYKVDLMTKMVEIKNEVIWDDKDKEWSDKRDLEFDSYIQQKLTYYHKFLSKNTNISIV
jgi:hypothetical protein